MAYINQNKNLKLLIIEPNGNVICSYVEIGEKKVHREVLFETIKEKMSHNKRIMKKLYKKEGIGMELINLVLDNDNILMYDTTNYANYTKYKDHTGIIMLPKIPHALPLTQKILLLKTLKELPLNLEGIKYDERFHLPYVTYSGIDIFYKENKKNFISIDSVEELVKSISENYENKDIQSNHVL